MDKVAYGIKWFASWFMFVLSPDAIRSRKEIEAISLGTAIIVSVLAIVALCLLALALSPSD